MTNDMAYYAHVGVLDGRLKSPLLMRAKGHDETLKAWASQCPPQNTGPPTKILAIYNDARNSPSTVTVHATFADANSRFGLQFYGSSESSTDPNPGTHQIKGFTMSQPCNACGFASVRRSGFGFEYHNAEGIVTLSKATNKRVKGRVRDARLFQTISSPTKRPHSYGCRLDIPNFEFDVQPTDY